jgi:L-alanine-DL-glutamate epimerase-like enolase superfamily enzyme
MKIADLEFYLLDPARGGPDNGAERSLLARVSTADGRSGWGESTAIWRASEIAARRESLLPLLAGRNVCDIEELLEIDGLTASPPRAAIEMACWDLIGRAARQPLHRLWGGEYRPRVPLAIRLPAVEPARAAQLAHDLAARGFHTQIVRARGDVAEDLAVVAAVRQAVGDRLTLRFDGCGLFSPEAARELARQLERFGLQFLLDPLASGLDGFAALARQTGAPLAASAAIHSPTDVLTLARSGAAPHVVVDIGQVGGLWPARKCAIVAAAGKLPFTLGGTAGLGVALIAALQLAASTPNVALAVGCEFYQLHEDILQGDLQVVDGMIGVPQGPGLGVDVDRARIDTYLVT